MSFFDAADEADRQQFQRPAEPEWFRIPREFVPTSLPLSVLLAHGNQVALALGAFEIYPTGFLFSLRAVSHPEAADRDHDVRADMGTFMGNPRGADRFRLGIEYANGSRASNDWPPAHGAHGEAPEAVLRSMGGGGGADAVDAKFWVWPIPAEGDLDLVYAWPVRDVPEQRFTLSGEELRAAAAAAQPIWDGLA